MKYLYPLAFVGTVFGANWAIETFGIVPVGFGLWAPAGVYFAGLAFTFRDLTQDHFQKRLVVGCIVMGAGLSWWVSPAFAVASGVAFLFSELADFAVYTPLRERHWFTAVISSNTVGAVLDSAIFLWLAFGSLSFIWGQVVGKTWVTLATVAVWGWFRRQ